jgi:hypothetical protein
MTMTITMTRLHHHVMTMATGDNPWLHDAHGHDADSLDTGLLGMLLNATHRATRHVHIRNTPRHTQTVQPRLVRRLKRPLRPQRLSQQSQRSVGQSEAYRCFWGSLTPTQSGPRKHRVFHMSDIFAMSHCKPPFTDAAPSTTPRPAPTEPRAPTQQATNALHNMAGGEAVNNADQLFSDWHIRQQAQLRLATP